MVTDGALDGFYALLATLILFVLGGGLALGITLLFCLLFSDTGHHYD